jgi:hypothetical protein
LIKFVLADHVSGLLFSIAEFLKDTMMEYAPELPRNFDTKY